jgi:hypothetical protein
MSATPTPSLATHWVLPHTWIWTKKGLSCVSHTHTQSCYPLGLATDIDLNKKRLSNVSHTYTHTQSCYPLGLATDIDLNKKRVKLSQPHLHPVLLTWTHWVLPQTLISLIWTIKRVKLCQPHLHPVLLTWTHWVLPQTLISLIWTIKGLSYVSHTLTQSCYPLDLATDMDLNKKGLNYVRHTQTLFCYPLGLATDINLNKKRVKLCQPHLHPGPLTWTHWVLPQTSTRKKWGAICKWLSPICLIQLSGVMTVVYLATDEATYELATRSENFLARPPVALTPRLGPNGGWAGGGGRSATWKK